MSRSAVMLINEINSNGNRALAGTPGVGETMPPFWDVTGDDFLNAEDVLAVINFINLRATGVPQSAEGEGLPTNAAAQPLGPLESVSVLQAPQIVSIPTATHVPREDRPAVAAVDHLFSNLPSRPTGQASAISAIHVTKFNSRRIFDSLAEARELIANPLTYGVLESL